MSLKLKAITLYLEKHNRATIDDIYKDLPATKLELYNLLYHLGENGQVKKEGEYYMLE